MPISFKVNVLWYYWKMPKQVVSIDTLTNGENMNDLIYASD